MATDSPDLKWEYEGTVLWLLGTPRAPRQLENVYFLNVQGLADEEHRKELAADLTYFLNNPQLVELVRLARLQEGK